MMRSERPTSLPEEDVFKIDIEKNSNDLDIAPNSDSKRRRKKSRKQSRKRKKKRRRKKVNRFIWFLVLWLAVYMVLVYIGIQLADQVLHTGLPIMHHNRPKKHPTLVPKFMAPEELLLPKPIVNVGFPKAGTSTIFSFFYCNGLVKAQHWYCCENQTHPGYSRYNKLMSSCMLRNMAKGKPIFERCGDFDVYTEINGPRHSVESHDMTRLDNGTVLNKKDSTPLKKRLFFPQRHYLEKIHQQYPNATLILNKRNTDAWVKSVLEWDVNLQYQILNEFYHQNATKFLFGNVTDIMDEIEGKVNEPFSRNETSSGSADSSVRGRTFKNERRKRKEQPFGKLDSRKNLLKSIYHNHVQYVRDWVTKYPSHALVEVKIDDDDAGETLAKAFGLKEECWGHFNKKTGSRLGKDNKKTGSRFGKDDKGMKKTLAISYAEKLPVSVQSRKQIYPSRNLLQ